MTPNNLDIQGGGSEDEPYHHDSPTSINQQDRRSKTTRDEVSSNNNNSSIVSTIGNTIVALPFTLLFMMLSMIFRVAMSYIGDSTPSPFNNWFQARQEENAMLEEIPEEQERQRLELRHIGHNQTAQKKQVEDLRRRIHALEERRKQHRS